MKAYTYKDWIYTIQVYICDGCGCLINESFPHIGFNNVHFCMDCAFKRGQITSDEYCKTCGVSLIGLRAAISPDSGEIELTTSKFSWEKPDNHERFTKDYVKWRKEVFERDYFICQNCGQRGGELQAHHIKSYSKYKRYRTDVKNGVTLCLLCHKKIHKRGGLDNANSKHIGVYPFVKENSKQSDNEQTF